ncbi:MAG: TerB family tellurite resistance protein [Opitutales bacterium]
MHGASLSLALAKVIVVSSPTVAQVRPADRHVIKDLLFQLPDLDQRDWAHISDIIDGIPEGSTEQIIAELRHFIATDENWNTAAYALERVFAGIPRVALSAELIETVLEAIATEPPPACLAPLGTLVEDSLMLRLGASRILPDDLDSLRELVRERTGRWLAHDTARALSAEELNRLCLEGTLISLVAHADGKVDNPEMRVCREFLCRIWGLAQSEAEFVLNVSLNEPFDGFDVLRVCRWLFELTTPHERLRFLRLLFELACVDDDLSEPELDSLISVAANLRVEQEQFHELFLEYGGVETPPPSLRPSRWPGPWTDGRGRPQG